MRRSTLARTLGLLTLSALWAVSAGCAAPAAQATDASTAANAHPEGYGAGLPERVAGLAPEIRARLPEARRIVAETIIVDTHVDVPYRLEAGWVDVTEATKEGDFDYPRAVAGGLDAPFMSIYIPAGVDAAGEGGELALRLIGYIEDIVRRAPDRFALARSPEDVVANWRAGRISLPMGMENCGPIRDPAEVAQWAERGIRYCSMAHSRSNLLADSSYDINEQWQGLSPLGRSLVPAMNDAGIMLDVSHLSDAATEQVMALSAVPVIASHSSARHFIPGFRRNLDDAMIRAIGADGGVVMMNFGSTFISQASRRSSEEVGLALQKYLSESGVAADSEAAQAWRDAFRADHPFRRATL